MGKKKKKERMRACLIYERELHALISPFKGLKKKTLMALIDFDIIYFDIIWDLALFQGGLGEMNKTQMKLKEKPRKEREREGQN